MSGLIYKSISLHFVSIDQLMLRQRTKSTSFLKPKSFLKLLMSFKTLKIDSILFRFKNPSSKFAWFGVKSTYLGLICLCWWFEVDLIQNPQILFDCVRNPSFWIDVFWVNLMVSWVVFAGLWLNRLDCGLFQVTRHSQLNMDSWNSSAWLIYCVFEAPIYTCR